jgi:hypothetical protein
MKLVGGVWHWANHADMDSRYPEVIAPIAAALWESHLLSVCGELGWTVRLDFEKHWEPASWAAEVIPSPSQSDRRSIGYTGDTPTRLEALARAMLAVPEVER